MSKDSEPFDFDNHGWQIDCNALTTPVRGVSPHIFLYDKLLESPDRKYACFFNTITEYHMGASAGLIAVYQNKNNPELLINPKNQWFEFEYGDNSLYFYEDMLFVRKVAYNENQKLSRTPFVVFDLTNKNFGFIDFDWSSIYYSIVKVSNDVFKFNLSKPNEIKNSDVPKRNNEEFNITEIEFYQFAQVDNLTELYLKSKTHKNF